MRICVLLLLLCALPLCAVTAAPEWDLSWVAGIEYTPSLAPGNSLWWWRWGEFAPQVDRELSLASQLFGFNFLRMFLHPMVFDGDTGRDNGTALFQAMDSFLAIATKYGMKSSFAFFDDCWNHAGASLTSPCTPIKGRHNGCWMAAPQDKDRTSVDRFRPYVYDTVRRFANDDRIALWEIFNEPNVQDTFSITLRSSAFGWALAALKDGTSGDGQGQRVPVLSCWDDNNSTQVSDMHRYDTFFPKWTQQVFQSPGKGALITEGGSRWFQGYDSDSGSPLTVLHWFHHLRSITPSAAAPFKFGMVTNWELMVGESNTRWHWDTKDNTPEPVIPWDGYMFPDGSPVSHTEAAAVRNWTRGVNEFLAFDSFLPDTHIFNEDQYLCLKAGERYTAQLKRGVDGSRVLVETTVWLSNSTGGGIVVRSDIAGAVGYFAGWRSSHPTLSIERWESGGNITTVASFDMSSLDCGLAADGWNMLRVVAEGSMISVYANPMFEDAVAAGGIRPRLVYIDQSGFAFTSGGVQLVSVPSTSFQDSNDGDCTRFDYIGVLDPSVL